MQTAYSCQRVAIHPMYWVGKTLGGTVEDPGDERDRICGRGVGSRVDFLAVSTRTD